MASPNNDTITTLIFDVDDTLYDVGTGFTAHRNGDAVQKYMVEHLKFPDMKSAKDAAAAFMQQDFAPALMAAINPDSAQILSSDGA